MVLARADFDYGNARLHARRQSLLSRSDYERLLAGDLNGLLGALSESPYAPDLVEVSGRCSGISLLHEAVRGHLARSLEEMRGFYRESARELLDLLLSKWDLHNLLALTRGLAAGAPAEETIANLVPVGALDQAAAAEVAGQSDAGRGIELLVGWRLPTPDLARGVARRWPAYVRTEDLAALEYALTADHVARLLASLSAFSEAGESLVRQLQREADARNTLIALRLRGAREPRAMGGDGSSEPFIAGGSLRPARVPAKTGSSGPQEPAALLGGAVRDPGLRDIIENWSPGQGLVELQRRLEARCARAAFALFHSPNPLSIDVPIAFSTAKQTEARNVRLVGEGIARGADHEHLAAGLLILEEAVAL